MLTKKEENIFESFVSLILFVVALSAILWCIVVWRQDTAQAGEYQDGYRNGYEYSESGMPSLPPMPVINQTPRTGEDQFVRGILDGREEKESEDQSEDSDR